MTPHLPITPQQIADEAVAAAAAGAAIIHLHARNPIDGRPTPAPDLFGEFLPAIKSRCDAVLGITTGGGQNMTVSDRLAAAVAFDPEMCSLNMGSMNFALFPALWHGRGSGEPAAHAPHRAVAVRGRGRMVGAGRGTAPDGDGDDGRHLLRVGLEDSIYLGKGLLAASANASASKAWPP